MATSAMAKEAMQLWKFVLEKLDSINNCPDWSSARHAAVSLRAALISMEQLSSTQVLPRAAWKTLITDLKVRAFVWLLDTGRLRCICRTAVHAAHDQ
jgi:hypothetical protein